MCKADGAFSDYLFSTAYALTHARLSTVAAATTNGLGTTYKLP